MTDINELTETKSKILVGDECIKICGCNCVHKVTYIRGRDVSKIYMPGKDIQKNFRGILKDEMVRHLCKM